MFEIISASSDHWPDWLRMREALYSGVAEAFHREEMEMIRRAGDKDCFLAVAPEGQVCGMVEVALRNVVDGCLSSPVAYLEGIYVDPPYRGQGLARVLLERAEQWGRQNGCREMGSDSELHNQMGQEFHRHMGFCETYRVIGYRKNLSAD